MLKNTRSIDIGGTMIGGNNPIAIQSMLNVSPNDVKASVKQINNLCDAGCEIVRMAVPRSFAWNFINLLLI